MTTRLYHSRYVHKISPRETDTGPDVALDDRARSNKKDLGAALREMRVMSTGERVNAYRIEPSGRIIVFPSGSGGMRNIWHSIILTPA